LLNNRQIIKHKVQTHRPVYFTHFHLLPWQRIHGAIPLFPLYSVMAKFTFLLVHVHFISSDAIPTIIFSVSSPSSDMLRDSLAICIPQWLYTRVFQIQTDCRRLKPQHLQHMQVEAQDSSEASRPQSEFSPP